MSEGLPIRGARIRRRGGPRRASRGFSPRRALAALAMLAAAGLVWGAVASSTFGVRRVEVSGAALTGEAVVRAALELPEPPPNAFTVSTDVLRDRLLALPTVDDAEVRVGLPGTLDVRVVEREPVLAWQRGDGLLLVDRDGRVLADAAASEAAATVAVARSLPTVVDRRTTGEAPAVGGAVDPLELAVATSLLSLVPADVGSTAAGLAVRVTDDDGWIVVPRVEEPWVAVFGFYGPEIRPPDMIPEQVRLLRSLLLDPEVGEATVARIILAGERSGTFVEREAP